MASTEELKYFQEIGPGFYNVKTSFTVLFGLLDIGTHMSLAKLSTGKFVAIDAVKLSPEIKAEIDLITDNGKLLDGFIGTHPFHTAFIEDFYNNYPTAKYFGCPRHLKNFPNIPWSADLNCKTGRSTYEPDLYMRIPDGAEFVDPQPANYNHFSNIFVFHPKSKTVFNDDCISVAKDPGFLFKALGLRDGQMGFHPSISGPGLYKTKEAPIQFKIFVQSMINDWDFDNFCTAHNGNIIGGAKKSLHEFLIKKTPTLESYSERNVKSNGDTKDDEPSGYQSDPKAETECG